MCISCGHSLAHDADPRRRYCNQSCRSRAFRQRDKAHRAAAVELVTRLVVNTGDFAALADVRRLLAA